MMIFNRYRPIYFIVFFNLLAFGLLFLRNPSKTVLFTCLIMMAMIYFVYFLLQWKKWGDLYLFLIVAMLSSIGLIMIFRLDPELGTKQIIWFAGGIILFLLSYCIFTYIKFWNKLTYFYIGLAIALFLLTLLFGSNISGATNWIRMGKLSVQPSEYIKIIFIFFLACYYAKPDVLEVPSFSIKERDIKVPSFSIKEKNIKMRNFTIKERDIKIPNNIMLSIVSYVFLVFFVLQREWGGAVLLFLIHIVLLFVFENDWKVILGNIALAFVGGLLGVLFVNHIQVRIDIWLNPWEDIAGKGYQVTQSLFAIGSGDFFGRGLGLGSPRYIPEVETDFIFSAICEEMGILGGVAVIMLYYILVYRGFKIALTVENTFYKAIALGITLIFAFQTFIIIGGVIKLIPLTGITLPFISYGGSSLTTSFIALGILQGISKDVGGDEV